MDDAMIRCPDCGRADVKVIKAGDGWRRRACQGCERRWTTDEVERAGSAWRKGDPIPTGRPVRQAAAVRLVTAGPGLLSPISGGLPEKGMQVGGIQDQGFLSSPLTLALVDPDQTQAHARSEKRAKKPSTKLERDAAGVLRMPFTVDFEAFWTAIGRGPGRKEPAFRAYVKRGSPDPARTAFTWKAYLASLPSDQVERGAITHVATWLNQGGHLDDYVAPAARRAVMQGSFVPSELPED